MDVLLHQILVEKVSYMKLLKEIDLIHKNETRYKINHNLLMVIKRMSNSIQLEEVSGTR